MPTTPPHRPRPDARTRPRAERAPARAIATDLRLAAIDVGSNSIHMIVAQVDAAGAVTTLWRLKEMVGLGRITFPSRRLSADAIERAIVTLRRCQQFAQQKEVEKIVAVATSAVREAENGGDFIERVRSELGLNIKVVSGKDEAKLIYLGVRHAVNLKGGPHLLIDIGGGSVEFIVANEARPFYLDSTKLGAARMTAKFVKSDPISKEDLVSLRRHYERELAPVCKEIRTWGITDAIGSSGTLENLSVMCSGHKSADHDGKELPPGVVGTIERDPLEKLVTTLIASSANDRATMPGLDEKRQDQVIAGAVLVQTLFRMLDLKQMRVCRSALREGILVDYFARHMPELQIRREVPDPRRRSILDLARRCTWNQSHSEHVAAIVLQLFDALKPLHAQGRRARELIEYGALLHDIGWHITAHEHHKHAMYLIMHGGLKGFTPEEIQIIANVARYHRKSPPKPEHDLYSSLPDRAKQIVRVGAALLRIADGLDRSHCGVVSNIKVQIGKRRIKIILQARGDTELETWAARRKMDVFEQVFGRGIVFETARRKG